MSRICIISQYFPPDIGGAVTRLSNLLKILQRIDHEIVIVTTTPHYPNGNIPSEYKKHWLYIETMNKLKIIRIRMLAIPHSSFINRLINYLFFVSKSLLAIPLVGKIDLIWVTSPNFFGNISGVIYKFMKRVPLILNIDDFWPDVVKELTIIKSPFLLKMTDLFNVFSFHYCDFLTPISTMLKKKIITKYHINQKKIHIIEVGVDYLKFTRNIEKIDGKKNRIYEKNTRKLLDSRHLIVYSGILGPAYDFEMLLKALKKLEKEFDDFEVIIQGEGPLKTFIEFQISKLGLQKTKVLSNHLPFHMYLNLLLEAFIFILPMKKGIFSETSIPAKLFTYLIMDKPIIATKGGDVETILKKSHAGIAIPHDDRILSRSLKLFLENESIYYKYCGNGSIYVKNNFSLNIIKKKVERLISEVI